MKQVKFRSVLLLLLIVLLGLGLALFCLRYTFRGEAWASFSANGHAYTDGVVRTGQVLDRNGTALYDGPSGVYHEDSALRQATLHAVGDQLGNISTSALEAFQSRLIGFDPLTGTLSGGHKVYLTIDADLSRTAWEALDGRKGVAAVYNYQTGDILCMVSNPSFDPADPPEISDDDSDYEGVYLNRLLSGLYTPGSVFKVVTTAAALDCVPDILDKTFTCYGAYEYGTEKVTCEKAHGTLTLKTALANSCNCAFAQIAELVGKKNMVKYVKQFGVTDSLSFDGVTTAEGNYDISNTAPVSFAWSCIGQHTDLINPARYMTFMGAIAGGGAGAEPYLVSEVRSGEELTYEAKTKTTGRIMSQDVADQVKAYMRNNVQSVYGDWNFNGMNVCAKSGTSQLGGGQKSNAMFAGFVEDEQYPLAFIVVVENGGYGSATCVPVLSKVLAACKSVLDGE